VHRRFLWSSFATIFLLPLAGCGNHAAKPTTAGTTGTSTLSLRAAIVTAQPLVVSCRGGAFCRENAFAHPADEEDAIAEAKEDCTTRGGEIGNASCSRAGAAATCSGSGPSGPTTVFAYDDGAVEKMSELCETLGGTFARAR
jgi:hypothetical protein